MMKTDDWREGRAEGHDMAYATMKRLRQSLEDVAALYEVAPVTRETQAEITKLMFAADTLIYWYQLYGSAFDDLVEG